MAWMPRGRTRTKAQRVPFLSCWHCRECLSLPVRARNTRTARARLWTTAVHPERPTTPVATAQKTRQTRTQRARTNTNMQRISITRTHHRLLADPRRVLAKPFLLGEELLLPGPSRAGLLLERILAIPEARVCALVEQLQVSFGHRHRNFSAILERHYELAVRPLGPMPDVSTARRLLIGAYFSHEYSVEAAALFNPSIVLAPDQSHLASGEARIIMSLRAVGE